MDVLGREVKDGAIAHVVERFARAGRKQLRQQRNALAAVHDRVGVFVREILLAEKDGVPGSIGELEIDGNLRGVEAVGLAAIFGAGQGLRDSCAGDLVHDSSGGRLVRFGGYGLDDLPVARALFKLNGGDGWLRGTRNRERPDVRTLKTGENRLRCTRGVELFLLAFFPVEIIDRGAENNRAEEND